MFEIITNASMRDELAQKGLKQAAKFSWEKCARETVQIYQKTVEDQ